jgi:SAM-dependent methyltransferase
MTNSSRLNSLLDKLKFDRNRDIRRKIIKIISQDQKTFDYGNGYFYQSSEKIGISGLRNTKMRVDALNLSALTKDKTILDIGTNTGFFITQIENNFAYCDGIDWNPTLIKVANEIKDYLEIKNIFFFEGNFLNYNFDKNYDLILSLANHTTYDGGIKNYKEYFEKVINILKKNGLLILESHHPSLESEDKFNEISNLLMTNFILLKKIKYKFFNYADDGRTVLFLKKNS